MMIQKQTEKGVSPVIGVILMVAITVIIAAVVANFVLDLGGNLGEDASASVTFSQSANYADGTYDVTVTTTGLDNADYTYTQIAGGTPTAVTVNQQSSDDDTEIASRVSSDHTDVAMVNSGDRIVYEDVDEEIDIQVFGVLDGSTNQIAGYSLSDDQRFFG